MCMCIGEGRGAAKERGNGGDVAGSGEDRDQSKSPGGPPVSQSDRGHVQVTDIIYIYINMYKCRRILTTRSITPLKMQVFGKRKGRCCVRVVLAPTTTAVHRDSPLLSI